MTFSEMTDEEINAFCEKALSRYFQKSQTSNEKTIVFKGKTYIVNFDTKETRVYEVNNGTRRRIKDKYWLDNILES